MPRFPKGGAQFQNNKKGGFYQPPYNHQASYQNSRDVDQFRYMDDSGKIKGYSNSGYQSTSGNTRQYDEQEVEGGGTSVVDTYQDDRHSIRNQQYPLQQYKISESNQYGTRYYEKNTPSGGNLHNSKGKYQQSAQQSQQFHSNQAKLINNNLLYYATAQNAYQSTSQGETRQYHRRETQDVFPYWQPLLKCENGPGEMSAIQRELFSQAEKGELLIDIQKFITILQESQEKALKNIQENECYELIDLAEEQGIVHRTKRNFANMKTLCFVSLQLDVVSSECLQWVLKSLRRDEMSPTERAIQSRIKEAFAFKISQQQWDFIIDCIKQQEPYEAQKTEMTEQTQIEGSSTSSIKMKGSSGVTTVIDSTKNANTSSNVMQPKKSRRGQTLQSQQIEEPPMFKFSDIIEDSAIGSISRAIFLLNEPEWLGVDQNNINSNQDPCTQNHLDLLYNELIEFLEDYFCNNVEDLVKWNQKEEEKWCSSIENGLTKSANQNYRGFPQSQTSPPQLMGTYEIDFEEVRAIPGGRYGCAQFVKICGPPKLRQCSLGRLAQLVQQAVKEDILRYHKTLLVWTTTVDKHKKKAVGEEAILNQQDNEVPKKSSPTTSKLFVVKQALIEILTENKQGMSLAQLPLYLRRKLQFSLDLNELGFPKLKDLILSMHDKIKLELRGHNHPFAYLIRNNSPNTEEHDETSVDQFQTAESHTTQKQTQDSEIIAWLIEQIDRSMRDLHDGLNQDQILGILSKRQHGASQFLGFQTLLDLIQKKVLSSHLAKERKWILTVHSETKFILNASSNVINQNTTTSQITNAKEKQLSSSSSSTFMKESGSHQPKSDSAKPTLNEEKIMIKVELLGENAIHDVKSQGSNDSVASSVNLSQELTRGGHSQPKTPSTIGNNNPFSPTQFTDQSQIGVAMMNGMSVLSPKSFQNTSSEHLKVDKPVSTYPSDNMYQINSALQSMNSQPTLEHSMYYNPNFQNNAYQKQNVSIQNQHQSQLQQTDGDTSSSQLYNNHLIWHQPSLYFSQQNFQKQQQLLINQQQQQNQLRNASFLSQQTSQNFYQPYPVYQQAQVQTSQMQQRLHPQQMQHQNFNQACRNVYSQEQLMIANNNQLPQQYDFNSQPQIAAAKRYENPLPQQYSNPKMMQASFESMSLNRTNQQQPYQFSQVQYQAQQQVQQQQNQQLFKQQLPIFNQQISQSSNGSSNGMTSVNYQTNNHYFQEQTANNNFSDAQYMSNESQQTTSIFQISPNQKMKQIMNTSNLQHEKDAAFHQTPFLPFDNDGKFAQFQQPQRVLVQHIHGEHDQNFKIKSMQQQQHQAEQMQQQKLAQKPLRQYQQQNIFSHPATNEHKHSTQQYNQYYHTFDTQEDEQQYPNRPSFGTPTDIQEQQQSIQMIEKLLQQDEDTMAVAATGSSFSSGAVVVRDFSEPDFSNKQPLRGVENGWKVSMNQQDPKEEIYIQTNFKPLPPGTLTPQPNQRAGILMQSLFEQAK